jgi:hypothetical protein
MKPVNGACADRETKVSGVMKNIKTGTRNISAEM